MDKYLIIGGRRGLSGSLNDVLADSGSYVSLVERSKWDPKQPKTLSPFLEKKAFDCVVVCAHIGFEIGEVLSFLIEATPQNTVIVVIGSMVSETQRTEYYPYQLEKQNYDATVRQLQLQHRERQISLLKPGLIDTDFVKDKSGIKMCPKEVALMLIECFRIMDMHKFNLISIAFTGKC